MQSNLQSNTATPTTRPISGTGIGLRSKHIDEILTTRPDIPWFELLADNHLTSGGLIPAQLDAICQDYPLTLHCVGMSLGSTDPLDKTYLQHVKDLAKRINSRWISEHLCFTAINGIYTHELIPFPYNTESLKHIVERISQAQEFFGERILIENVSSYMAFNESDIPEAEFIAAVAEQADCWLLIDVNNIYVNQVNHGLDGKEYINSLPLDRIKEVHLAGYEEKSDFLLDAHNNPVSEPVWELYEQLLLRNPDIPTLIEWDNNIPSLETLLNEAKQATAIAEKIRDK